MQVAHWSSAEPKGFLESQRQLRARVHTSIWTGLAEHNSAEHLKEVCSRRRGGAKLRPVLCFAGAGRFLLFEHRYSTPVRSVAGPGTRTPSPVQRRPAAPKRARAHPY